MGCARPPPRALRHRAATVLARGPRDRGGCAPHDAAARHGNLDIQPARGRLALGALAQGCGILAHLEGPADRPLRHDQPREPAQARPRGRSEEHTSELQSLMRISYAVIRLKKKSNHNHSTEKSYRQNTVY